MMHYGNAQATFDEAEIALLKEGLKRSYKERFEMATRLYEMRLCSVAILILFVVPRDNSVYHILDTHSRCFY